VTLKLHISGFSLHWRNDALRKQRVAIYVLNSKPPSFSEKTARRGQCCSS